MFIYPRPGEVHAKSIVLVPTRQAPVRELATPNSICLTAPSSKEISRLEDQLSFFFSTDFSFLFLPFFFFFWPGRVFSFGEQRGFLEIY